MTQSIIDIGDAINDGTGDPAREAFNKCNNNFTELYAADAAGGGGTATPVPPQGRLTLQTVTPVMTTTQAAKTAIFYTPYVGNQIVLFNDTSMVSTTFTELTVATTNTANSPAAIGANKVNDWFVWDSGGGTLRLVHGPDWTNDTTRSAGTALVRVSSIWTNAVAITNGPAIQRGTYVGTTRSNASSQLDWIFGSANTGGAQAGSLFVWNAYNRVRVASFVGDTTSSWAYNSSTWRQINGSAGNQISIVSGLSIDALTVRYYTDAGPSSGAFAAGGIGINSTTTASAAAPTGGPAGAPIPFPVEYASVPAVGVTTIAALEATNGGTGAVFYGTGGAGGTITGIQQTMIIDFVM